LLATGLASYANYPVEGSPLVGKAMGVAVVLVLAGVNIGGVRLGAGLLRWLTYFKLGLLGLLACWGFGGGLGDWSNFLPLVERPADALPLGKALPGALVLAFFSFAGWWDVTRMAGELENPGRTVPRALMLGVTIVTATYVLVSAVFLYLVPVGQVTNEQTFAAQAGQVLFGHLGAVLFSGMVIVAILGSLTSFVMGAPRVYYAMARDGLFLPAMAAVHPRFGTPARAIALQAVLASVLLISGTFDQILAYFFFSVVAFLALTIGAVFVLRWRSPPPPEYRIPGYPLTPLLFLIPVAGLLVLLALDSPAQSLLGAGVVVAGVPVYYLVFRRGKSP
jgi:APA family basic amino acid/polyamine antiporter